MDQQFQDPPLADQRVLRLAVLRANGSGEQRKTGVMLGGIAVGVVICSSLSAHLS